jgi:hypothetical protein
LLTTALTGLLARLLVLLSALVLIILVHNSLRSKCELSRYQQLPLGFFVPSAQYPRSLPMPNSEAWHLAVRSRGTRRVPFAQASHRRLARGRCR